MCKCVSTAASGGVSDPGTRVSDRHTTHVWVTRIGPSQSTAAARPWVRLDARYAGGRGRKELHARWLVGHDAMRARGELPHRLSLHFQHKVSQSADADLEPPPSPTSLYSSSLVLSSLPGPTRPSTRLGSPWEASLGPCSGRHPLHGP